MTVRDYHKRYLIFRLLAAKRIELELKALDANKLNRTIEDLCHESAPDELWLKCTYGKWNGFEYEINDRLFLFAVILRTEFELQNLLRQAINEPDVPDVNYRPRPGWLTHKSTTIYTTIRVILLTGNSSDRRTSVLGRKITIEIVQTKSKQHFCPDIRIMRN